jgi:hypothetical protein
MLSLAAVNFAAMNLIQWLIVAIVVAGCIGIAVVVFRQANFTIPPFVKLIFWIVVCVVIAVVAIKFLASMM